MNRGYEDLMNAVVEQAVKDYRVALIKAWRAQQEVERLERFFTDGDCSAWTKLDGTKLAQAVRDEVIEYKYDLKALNKSHSPLYGKKEIA